ncbi:MAG: alkaline phosphatase family protein [Bdellovibrio sp.]|nr:alkaline phosphatase family protein [Bdellovibrio sp.]
MYDLRSFTPTICQMMGVPSPKFGLASPISELLHSRTPISKALIYCPDAFGYHALQRFPNMHERLRRASTHEVALSSMIPPKTPVCFATLFTGGSTEEHGIKKYERPVLTCDTLFDAFVRAGKKVAIVAVAGSSVDTIFKNRNIDYFSKTYDSLVTVQTLELLQQNKHDVIVAYHQEYDDLLHHTEPFSPLAVKALQNHLETWEQFLPAAQQAWKNNYLLAFTPDHGAHMDPSTNRGDHNQDCPEDMQLRHFFCRC